MHPNEEQTGKRIPRDELGTATTEELSWSYCGKAASEGKVKPEISLCIVLGELPDHKKVNTNEYSYIMCLCVMIQKNTTDTRAFFKTGN